MIDDRNVPFATCPFHDEQGDEGYHIEQYITGPYYVICNRCCAKGPAGPTEQIAIARWNERKSQ
jgi:hypothetical protein